MAFLEHPWLARYLEPSVQLPVQLARFDSSLQVQHVKLLLSFFHKYSMPMLTDLFYHLGVLFVFSNEAGKFLRYFVVKLQLSWKAASTAMPCSLHMAKVL